MESITEQILNQLATKYERLADKEKSVDKCIAYSVIAEDLRDSMTNLRRYREVQKHSLNLINKTIQE